MSSSYFLRVSPRWEDLLNRIPISVRHYLTALLEDWQLSLTSGSDAADQSFTSLADISVGYLRVEDYYIPDGMGLEARLAKLFEA